MGPLTFDPEHRRSQGSALGARPTTGREKKLGLNQEQGGHSPGKPGKVKEFQSGQGKVRESGKSQRKVREFYVVWKVATL